MEYLVKALQISAERNNRCYRYGRGLESFFMKFTRRLLSVNNLRTSFFIAKYVKIDDLCNLNLTSIGSRFWKAILKVLLEVYANCFVKVCDRKFSIWFDGWLNASSLVERVPMILNPKLKIRCWNYNQWDE